MLKVEKINKKADNPRILIAPLDWGLGHATRSIPLIKLLIKHDIEVIIAAEGAIAVLLEKEFPTLVILRLKGYQVKYSNNRGFFFLKMLTQFPKISAAIAHERKWLDKIVATHKIDAVISDNRFGFYSNKIPCVFITHQLAIKTGSRLLDKKAQQVNYRYINKFSECWIPDVEGDDNLAGELSHPKTLPAVPVKYAGILSRCEKMELKNEIDLLVLISGPEPQRSIFENILLSQLKDTEKKVAFIRGLPAEENVPVHENKNICTYNHLPASELNELIQKSKLVIARCGYSTVMDLVSLKQKAILIPTPGQTEQEYLAKHLKEKKIFFTTGQENFSLHKAMNDVNDFEFTPINISPGMNEDIIVDWLERLPQRR